MGIFDPNIVEESTAAVQNYFATFNKAVDFILRKIPKQRKPVKYQRINENEHKTIWFEVTYIIGNETNIKDYPYTMWFEPGYTRRRVYAQIYDKYKTISEWFKSSASLLDIKVRQQYENEIY